MDLWANCCTIRAAQSATAWRQRDANQNTGRRLNPFCPKMRRHRMVREERGVRWRLTPLPA
jgi:hypothetical protein